MKQKLYLSVFMCFILGLVFTFTPSAFDSAQAKSVEAEKVSCGKVLSDGEIQVFEAIECGREKEFSNSNGCPVAYQKTVHLTKQFKKRVKENIYETKAEIKQKFKFTYDKKEKVWITPENISSNVTITGWKISPISEISVDDEICSVSNKYRVYDKNFVGNFQYMCDGFADIFCDCNGEIGVNSDVRW